MKVIVADLRCSGGAMLFLLFLRLRFLSSSSCSSCDLLFMDALQRPLLFYLPLTLGRGVEVPNNKTAAENGRR